MRSSIALRLGLAALLGAGTELAALGLLGTATWLLVTAAGQPPLAVLGLAIVTVRALALGRSLGRYAERLAGHDAALWLLARLRTRTYAAVSRGQGAPARTGDALSRLVSDVDAVQDLLLRCLVPALVSAVVAGAALGFVGAVSPVAALALAVGIGCAALALPALGYAVTRRSGAVLAAERGALSAASLDVVRGAADLVGYGAADAAVRRAEAHARTVARLECRTGMVACVVGTAGAALPGLTALAVVAVSGRAGVLPAVLGVITLGAVEAMAPLSAAAPKLAEMRGAWARVRSVLDGAAPALSTVDLAEPLPDATVVLRDALVRYGPGTPAALDGVDLDLGPGRRVAVVGPSGAGKSTLVGVLTGEVPLTDGVLSIGGVTDPAQRWRLVGGLLSGAHVFHATVRDNLTLGRPAAPQALRGALGTAGLGEYADRLDAMAGEDGATMSGGERHRLTLARALLAPTPVVVLDEPAEGLDPDAADTLLAGVLDALDGRAVLMVTHRLVGLARFDEILVLDGGRVVQRGDHHALLAADGWYREAWLSQQLAEEVYQAASTSSGS
jgi:ATP-binding cassette subfamily C protein CydC